MYHPLRRSANLSLLFIHKSYDKAGFHLECFLSGKTSRDVKCHRSGHFLLANIFFPRNVMLLIAIVCVCLEVHVLCVCCYFHFVLSRFLSPRTFVLGDKGISVPKSGSSTIESVEVAVALKLIFGLRIWI